MNQRIIQAALEVQCSCDDCKARIVVPTHYRGKAATMAEKAGWKHSSRLGWLCPDHRMMRRIHTRIRVPSRAEVQRSRAMQALERYQAEHPEFSMEALAEALKQIGTKDTMGPMQTDSEDDYA